MSKEKNKILTFELNSFELVEDNDDVSIVKLRLLHWGENRNKCDIDEACCLASESSVYNCPIIYRLNNKYVPQASTDVQEHSRDNDPTMQIGGIVPMDTPIDYVYDENNGKTYMEVMGIIYKAYQPYLMKILEIKNGTTKVSIEILVLDGEKKSNGILKINKMKFRGITLLGDKITEGIEGSKLDVVKFSESELNNQFKKFSKNNQDNYTIPNSVKSDIKQIYSLYQTNHKGLTEKELLVINSLNNKEKCNFNEINIIKSCFDNYNKQFDFNYNSDWLNKVIENEVLEMSMGVSELRQAMYTELSKYNTFDENDCCTLVRYDIQEIYTDECVVIVHDYEENKIYKALYHIDGENVHIDMDNKVQVKLSYEELIPEREENEYMNAYIFSKSTYGSGGKLKVSKKKEDMSDSEWGSVNKSELRKRVLDASNYKTLVKDVYLEVEEGWEDSPSTKLKYPVMGIKGDKLVYNRNALSSAKGYAEKENETSVINKLDKIYKKLELDTDKKEGKLMTEKEKEEQLKKNKLDDDNKELEDIRDDADADEDDEKEELKKNAVGKDAEEKIDDDVDADKDYWKKKYAEDLEVKNAEIEEMKAKFAKMERKELEKKMSALIEEYSACYNETEKNSLKEEIKNSKTEEEFSAKVFACVAKNAKAVKDKEVKNSFVASPFGANLGYQAEVNSDVNDIHAIAKKYK